MTCFNCDFEFMDKIINNNDVHFNYKPTINIKNLLPRLCEKLFFPENVKNQNFFKSIQLVIVVIAQEIVTITRTISPTIFYYFFTKTNGLLFLTSIIILKFLNGQINSQV